jgi:WG containing repeat
MKTNQPNPQLWDELRTEGDYTKMQKAGRWGLMTQSGQVVVPCVCRDAEHIQAHGQEHFSAHFPLSWTYCLYFQHLPSRVRLWYEFVEPFVDGLARVYSNGKFGYVDYQANEVVPCAHRIPLGQTPEGLHWVEISDKVGLANTKGDLLTAHLYEMAWDFQPDGLAKVQRYLPEAGYAGCFYINARGEEVAKAPDLELNPDCSPTPAVSQHFYHIYSVKNGFLAKALNPFVNCFDDNRNNFGLVIKTDYSGIGIFENGLALVQKNQKYGLLNDKGQELVACEYDFIGFFEQGYARVCLTLASDIKNAEQPLYEFGKWGLINTKGELVVPCLHPQTADLMKYIDTK